MREELLNYYEKELAYFRKQAGMFAAKYPKIASKLQVGPERSDDPHVERMIEAFAFLSGRIRLKLDDEFPEITESFLNILYPHYLRPIPSMSIVQMRVFEKNSTITTGQMITKDEPFTKSIQAQHRITFQPGFSSIVWPMDVFAAALESTAPMNLRGRMERGVFRIHLRCDRRNTLASMRCKTGKEEKAVDHLRFFINGEPQFAFPIYEILFNKVDIVQLVPIYRDPKTGATSEGNPLNLPPSVLKPVGFEREEALLPYPEQSFPGYGLLTEYFTFPEKFLFFDVTGIEAAVAAGFPAEFEVRMWVRDIEPPPGIVDKNTFMLGCVPVVNLYKQDAEPIQVNRHKHEYHIVPEANMPSAYEVYSIDQVRYYRPGQQESRTYEPFYSFRHDLNKEEGKRFWYADRRPSMNPHYEGTEMYISLADLDFNPDVAGDETLHLKLTCTNRDFAGKLQVTGQYEEIYPKRYGYVDARFIRKCTPTVRPPLRKGAQWRLISHLALNHLSLVSSDENGTPHALREILQLYDFTDSQAVRNQISGLLSIKSRPVVRQLGQFIGTGFVRGIETTVEFDETQFTGSGVYLFASVLERFLGLYVSMNSFSQLVAKSKQREEIVRKWAPRAGNRVIL